MTNNLFNQLEKNLSQPTPMLSALLSQNSETMPDVSGDERVRVGAIHRLLRGINAYEEKRANLTDVIILMRQVLRGYGRLRVHPDWWKPFRQLAG